MAAPDSWLGTLAGSLAAHSGGCQYRSDADYDAYQRLALRHCATPSAPPREPSDQPSG
ncbi:hypothetical protein [Spirilliplanes yamanashiensis]|uniref:Uncharacterized protein n=1 Tax=Spirilliplanes yamanashiensis TaxID=42233 RepID=A0A8J3Y592_9ACTN|nr:hypothetical protein [Spirilliplanes yamanashiensis]MDP9819416.1 hypothetical protein [Spirilliplanes yamanashiensis]GIJ01760.1 hypothetical protein Sya03_11120 [Spirilliplanes yamanashiensis]